MLHSGSFEIVNDCRLTVIEDGGLRLLRMSVSQEGIVLERLSHRFYGGHPNRRVAIRTYQTPFASLLAAGARLRQPEDDRFRAGTSGIPKPAGEIFGDRVQREAARENSGTALQFSHPPRFGSTRAGNQIEVVSKQLAVFAFRRIWGEDPCRVNRSTEDLNDFAFFPDILAGGPSERVGHIEVIGMVPVV